MASLTRTRWAAIGAAVAVTLGAGGIGLVLAAPLSTGERTVLVPANCRLADTRAGATNVGTKTSPLGAGETHTFSAHGTNGNCTIPADATALNLNVTAVGATATRTFLTFWGADQPQPLTSSLNPAAGQPPTPNALTTDLSATGQFKTYNDVGSVNVIIDITGYYQDHNHDDRYYTKDQLDPRFDGQKFISIDVFTDPGFNFDERYAQVGVGGLNLDVDYNFTVPPDYTPGTAVTIRVLAAASGATSFPCNGQLSVNYARVNRPGIAPVNPGPVLGPPAILHIMSAASVAAEYLFTLTPAAGQIFSRATP